MKTRSEICRERINKYWSEVRAGKRPKPKNGRKAGQLLIPIPPAILSTLAEMPPLPHASRGGVFAPSKSAVYQRICETLNSDPFRLEISKAVFDLAKRKNILRYHPQSGLWHGSNFGKNKPDPMD